MLNICLRLPKYRPTKRIYCRSLAENNLSLANNLKDDIFIGTSDFKGK